MVEENKDSIPAQNTQNPKTENTVQAAVSAKKGVSVKKKKSTKKSASKKAAKEAKTVSKTVKSNKEFPWKLVAIILAVVMLVLIAVILGGFLTALFLIVAKRRMLTTHQ